MLFDAPIPFAEAIRYAASKQLLPSTLTSAELRTLRRELRRRSVFSAQVTDGGFLQEFNDLVEAIVGGPDEADFAARLAGERPLLMSIPDAKAQLGDYLDAIGYEPEPGEEGTIKDLRTNARRQLIVETNVLDTQGYGRWAAGQNDATLDQFPALELVRMRFSKVPRDWEERWDAAREETDPEGATEADSGRLVALKNHPIWQALGDGAGGYTDTLGNPWPPFAFNSGMGVLDVIRADAMELGICDEHTVVAPQPVNRLNESVQASVANWDAELKKQLAQGGFKIIDNGKTLTMANADIPAMRSRIAALLDGCEAVMFANMGTSEGAIKGWETRRRSIARDIKAVRRAVRIGLNQKRDMPEVIQRGNYRLDFDHGRPGNLQAAHDDGYGTSHADLKHGEDMRKLPITVSRGSFHEHEDPNKVYVVHKDHVAVFSKKPRNDGTRSQTRLGFTTHYKDGRTARWASQRAVLLEGR